MGMGTASKVAIKKGSTWGTDATPGSGSQVPFVSCSMQPMPGKIDNEDLNTSGVQDAGFLGNTHGEGSLVIDGAFEQAPHLLLAALFMGTAGTPTTVEAGVYRHELPWTADTDGLFASFWTEFSSDAYGWASVKPESRTIAVEAAGRYRETYGLVGYGLDKTVSFGSVTYADDPVADGTKRILQRHMTIRANAQGGGALGSSDELPVTAATLSMTRSLTRDFTAAGALEEPVRSGWGEISLNLTFHRQTAALMALLSDAYDSHTALKLDMVFDHGVLLGSTKNRTREYYFPYLLVQDNPREIAGPGPNPFTVTLKASRASAAPTGFPTGNTEPVTEFIQNEQSADPLA